MTSFTLVVTIVGFGLGLMMSDQTQAGNWNTKKSEASIPGASESSNESNLSLSQFDKNDVGKFKEIDPLNRDWSSFEFKIDSSGTSNNYKSFRTEDFHQFLITGGPFEPIGPKSNNFDGKYRYEFWCPHDDQNTWDGSEFVIRDGQISNTKTGAGRITVETGHVDVNGSFFIKYFRSGPNTQKYLGSDIFVSGNLRAAGDPKYANSKLEGNYRGYKSGSPTPGGSKDDGKRRYHFGCVGKLTKTGDIEDMPAPFSADEAIVIKTKSPSNNWQLLDDVGSEIEVEVKIAGNETQRRKGFVLIVPSSTPSMSDEEFYATKYLEMGYAVAVIYGADPRFEKKFGSSYTTYMQARDVVETLRHLTKAYSDIGSVVVTGSSQGSLAALRTVIQPFSDSYPVLEKITHLVLFNAACFDVVEAPFNQKASILAITGTSDNAIPMITCANMEKNSDAVITRKLYSGGHHFESPLHAKEITDAPHVLANCALIFHDNFDETAKARRGDFSTRLTKNSSFEDYSSDVYENCLEKGTISGYEEESAKQMWSDVEDFLNAE